ncbi:MAG TPA: hypothetical protein VFC46_07530 [Humisphaera sp.]|nr:hypothetical protein [Humisphaera sp.]
MRRTFLISPGMVGLFLATFFGVELLLALSIGQLVKHESWLFIKGPAHFLQRGILLIAMVAYGAWRALRFHPAINNPYRNWLMSTPWTAAMPLPLGPITLAWQDALLLALAAPLAIYADVRLHEPAVAFCGGYAAGALWALLVTEQYRSAYMILIGFAVLVRLQNHPAGTTAIAAGLAVTASIAMDRSLRDFPWKIRAPFIFNDRPAAPFDRLGQLRTSPKFSPLQAAMIGLLIAAWSYVCVWASEESKDPSSSQTSWLSLGLLIAAIRVMTYLINGYMPPISFLGRMFTGKIIIAGFDKILLTPACIILIFLILPPLFSRANCSDAAVFGLTVGIATAAALGLGPNLNKWRLTGSHRIVLKQKINEQARLRTSR